MASITLEALQKTFGKTTAVDAVDLTVADGEFLVLVGPSGCGKSTLLRTIAGLETATDGHLYIGGERVNELEPKNRGVAMIFQNYALYPHMSARRNMTFGLGSHGSFTDTEVDEMVRDVSEMLGIDDLLNRKPSALSGGEKQRVAMGRALLREPEVFLLDEPLSNLDAKLRDDMRAELRRLHDRIETTTVYVTHDQTEAMTLGDRVAVMHDGGIEQVDDPQRVYDRPTSRFVAEFIGSPRINVFEATVEHGGRTLTVRGDDFAIEVPARETAEFDDRSVKVGIRPEDLYLVDDIELADLSAPFEIEVTHQETLGNSLIVYGRTGGEAIRIQTDTRRAFDVGDRIDVAADLTRIHLFDPETGAAIYRSGDDESPTLSVAGGTK